MFNVFFTNCEQMISMYFITLQILRAEGFSVSMILQIQ